MNRTLQTALLSLLTNIIFSAYHIILGFTTHSWWFITIGVYYAVLSIIRFTVIRSRRNLFTVRFTGIMLMALSLPLIATVILSFIRDTGSKFHLIIMLVIAIYSFTKITLAAINWVKSRKINSPKLVALRNISFADAFVSIFSLQRSMLVSFEGMTQTDIRIMNAATGSAVCIIVFILGLNVFIKEIPKEKRTADR